MKIRVTVEAKIDSKWKTGESVVIDFGNLPWQQQFKQQVKGKVLGIPFKGTAIERVTVEEVK